MVARKQARISGKTFYEFEMRRCSPGECVDQVNGWIAADDAEFVTDLFEFEMQYVPAEERELIQTIAAGRRAHEHIPPLRVASAKIEPIQLGATDEDTRHYLVKMDVGLFELLSDAYVVAETPRGYELIGEFDSAEMVEYQGRHFLVSSEMYRISLAYSIHEFTGRGFNEIFKSDNNAQYYTEEAIVFSPPHLTVQEESYPEGGGTRRFRLTDSGFKQISFVPHKPPAAETNGEGAPGSVSPPAPSN
jgi:hypothetical protein